MIRREVKDETGQVRWVLIPQIEHALLAFRLAEHWGQGSFAPLEPRAELLWAVAHHDDGWRDWDASPGVDPVHGRPRSFTEMEIADSVAIWSGSIETAAAAGPLQGYVVAGHFCVLARRASAWRNADPAWDQAEAFLRKYEALMQDW